MFFNIFSELCNERGIKPSRVALDLDLSKATVTKWKKGANPNGDTLSKIADYFGVTVDYLLTGENRKPLINDDEELTEYLEELKNRPELKMLFSLAKGATKADVERAVTIIDALLRSEKGE